MTSLVSLEAALSLSSCRSNYANCISPRSSMRGESLHPFLLSHRDDETFANGQHYKVQKLWGTFWAESVCDITSS